MGFMERSRCYNLRYLLAIPFLLNGTKWEKREKKENIF